MTFGYSDRQDRVDRLSATEFDFLIVGGGITGTATARDAAMRGFSVACVEKVDFSYGTSSRSSKLIHGGLRYLEQGNLRLVFEGTHERATQRTVAPHLVRPIPFLVPVYDGAKHGTFTLGVGLWMYDTLAGKRRYGRHSRHDSSSLLEREPTLRAEGLKGGAIYFDCMTDDARLCVENAVSAHEQGAVMLNRATFLEPMRDEESGLVVGGIIRDEQTGQHLQVRATTVVHCAGPWTDVVLQSHGDERGMLRVSKGAHICFDRRRLPVEHAVVMSAISDRRVVFAIPRGRITIVGTTDTDYDGSPDEVCASREDVDYLMETLRWYFPEHNLATTDIRSTYAGLRPLVRDDSDNPYNTSREHTVVARGDGTVTIGGGKYTTYRRMANDVINAAMKARGLKRSERPECPTEEALLPGAVDLDLDAERQRLVDRGLDEETAEWLVLAYGKRHERFSEQLGDRLIEGLPFHWAEVDYALEEEAATSVDDILTRRLPIFFEAPDQGLEIVESLADHLANVLGWDEEKRAAEVEIYRAAVAQSRRWKS